MSEIFLFSVFERRKEIIVVNFRANSVLPNFFRFTLKLSNIFYLAMHDKIFDLSEPKFFNLRFWAQAVSSLEFFYLSSSLGSIHL